MKAKTIKEVIHKKIADWLSSVEDTALRKDLEKGVMVTGGAIASMLLGEKVNDFDVYFRSHELTKRAAEYYVNRFSIKNKNGQPGAIRVSDIEGRVSVAIKSAGIASEEGTEKPYEYFEARPEDEAAGYVSDIMSDPGDIQEVYEETSAIAQETENDGKPKYRPVFLSTNAITLSHRIQLVLRFYGEPDAIHENYDFVHCTNYWTSWDNALVLRQPALEALLAKELRYIGSKYPICSLLRLRKFIQRGWTVNAGQILKMALQVSELNMKDYNVLREQLTGVDTAYFSQVLAKVAEKDPTKLDAAYLVEILDRMF